MIARLLISPNLEERIEEIRKVLSEANLTPNHPDLLYLTFDSKLGIEQARAIIKHFSLKPYSAKGRAVVLEDATDLTTEAQNALLKTLEEPPEEAILILGAKSDANLLPTILSRCQIMRLQGIGYRIQKENYSEDITKLLSASIEERFEYIEKLKDREEFLHALVSYLRHLLHQKITKHDAAVQRFVTELLQAEEWAEANVNIRGILEYLMLKMPKV